MLGTRRSQATPLSTAAPPGCAPSQLRWAEGRARWRGGLPLQGKEGIPLEPPAPGSIRVAAVPRPPWGHNAGSAYPASDLCKGKGPPGGQEDSMFPGGSCPHPTQGAWPPQGHCYGCTNTSFQHLTARLAQPQDQQPPMLSTLSLRGNTVTDPVTHPTVTKTRSLTLTVTKTRSLTPRPLTLTVTHSTVTHSRPLTHGH